MFDANNVDVFPQGEDCDDEFVLQGLTCVLSSSPVVSRKKKSIAFMGDGAKHKVSCQFASHDNSLLFCEGHGNFQGLVDVDLTFYHISVVFIKHKENLTFVRPLLARYIKRCVYKQALLQIVLTPALKLKQTPETSHCLECSTAAAAVQGTSTLSKWKHTGVPEHMLPEEVLNMELCSH